MVTRGQTGAPYLKSLGGNPVWVRLPPRALEGKTKGHVRLGRVALCRFRNPGISRRRLIVPYAMFVAGAVETQTERQ